MATESWIDVGAAEELAKTPLRSIQVGRTPVALSYKDGTFGAVSNLCNHVGGTMDMMVVSSTGMSTADSDREFFYGHSPLRFLNDGKDEIGRAHV